MQFPHYICSFIFGLSRWFFWWSHIWIFTPSTPSSGGPGHGNPFQSPIRGSHLQMASPVTNHLVFSEKLKGCQKCPQRLMRLMSSKCPERIACWVIRWCRRFMDLRSWKDRPGLPIEMAVWHFRAYRSSCTIYSGHMYIYIYYAAVGTGQLDIE